MKVSQLVVSLLVGVCVYLVGVLLFGQYNAATYDQLQAHLERLTHNVEQLSRQRDSLEAQIEQLRRSRETIRVAARDLQYYLPDESVIRIEGYDGRQASASPGAVLTYEVTREDNRTTIRAAAIVAFLLTLLLQLMIPASRPAQTEIIRASR
jgi:cell division protein FtsB